MTFGDVRRNGYRCPCHLAYQPEPFRIRQLPRSRIHLCNQIHPELPYDQISKRLNFPHLPSPVTIAHNASPFPKTRSPTPDSRSPITDSLRLKLLRRDDLAGERAELVGLAVALKEGDDLFGGFFD